MGRSIQAFFELSYAQYLTIPRSVLQSMPQEWQQAFVALLDELDETIDWRPPAGQQYRVGLFETKVVDLDEEDPGPEAGWGSQRDDALMDYRRGRRQLLHRPARPREIDDHLVAQWAGWWFKATGEQRRQSLTHASPGDERASELDWWDLPAWLMLKLIARGWKE